MCMEIIMSDSSWMYKQKHSEIFLEGHNQNLQKQMVV